MQNDWVTSRGSKWLSLLGDSSWLAVAQRKMKTHSWFENSFIVTNNFVAANGTKARSLQAPRLDWKSPSTGSTDGSCPLKVSGAWMLICLVPTWLLSPFFYLLILFWLLIFNSLSDCQACSLLKSLLGPLVFCRLPHQNQKIFCENTSQCLDFATFDVWMFKLVCCRFQTVNIFLGRRKLAYSLMEVIKKF